LNSATKSSEPVIYLRGKAYRNFIELKYSFFVYHLNLSALIHIFAAELLINNNSDF
jgi:hypothetical protein